uniref:Uncharacterized protein n=1 Tax=Anatid alphaherpesvirus 2 TaxID=3080522 RepID=A0AAU0K7Y9_9ALPH
MQKTGAMRATNVRVRTRDDPTDRIELQAEEARPSKHDGLDLVRSVVAVIRIASL